MSEALPLSSAREDGHWPLPTSGDVEWQAVVELCGMFLEGSIPTEHEWDEAVRDSRVVTIHYSDSGKPYYARVGLHEGRVMCRAVFSRSLPCGVTLQGVDLDTVSWDFASSVEDAGAQEMAKIRSRRPVGRLFSGCKAC